VFSAITPNTRANKATMPRTIRNARTVDGGLAGAAGFLVIGEFVILVCS